MQTLKTIAICVLVAVIAWCGYQAVATQEGYSAEETLHQSVMRFKPQPPENAAIPPGAIHTQALSEAAPDAPADYIDQRILGMQAKYPHAVGWLTVPYTAIDYPFVQTADNDFYQRRDLDGKPAQAGTIYMDYRSARDFSDFNTVLYGHNRKNGTMFNSLKRYYDRAFFERHNIGELYLADRACTVEFFAFMIIKYDDHMIYNLPRGADTANIFMEYVQKNARHYRELNITHNDHIITLSTCAFDFANARMVLIGRLILTTD